MQTIGNPKHTVYLSASWHKEHEEINHYIARILADQYGLIVIGDHRDYRKEKNIRGLNYRDRVDEILNCCSGVVLIFPKQNWPQTTSSRMFVEFLLAAKQNLPILIFIEDGVEVEWERGNEETVFTFGMSKKSNELSVSLCEIIKESFRSSILNDIHSVKLPTPIFLNDPIILSSNKEKRDDDKVNSAIESFQNALLSNRQAQYAFIIAPYDQSSERQVIAETVFQETGLPSVNASDSWAGAPYDSKEIKTKITEAYFVIADLTEVRHACVFEAGVAVGSGRSTFIVRRSSSEELPFGLRKCETKEYLNSDSLRAAVKNHCRQFRRRVFNNELLNLSNNKQTVLPPTDTTLNVPDKTAPTRSWLSMSRLRMSIWSGVLFVLLAIAILVIHHFLTWPLNLFICAIIIVGALITLFVLMHNPLFFYRRLIKPALWSGILINTSGFSLSALTDTAYGFAGFTWSGSTAWSFNIFWIGVIGILVVADLKTHKDPQTFEQ